MEAQENTSKNLKSTKQIAQQLNVAKQEFDNFVNYLIIPPMTSKEDLQQRSPTIQSILKNLPNEQRLNDILDHPRAMRTQYRQQIIRNYLGNYSTIKKAAQNLKNIKPEAQRLYYLASELNLNKIQHQLDKTQDIKLKSYEITKNDNNRVSYIERNTFGSNYLRELKEQELKTITTHSSNSEFLQIGQILLTIILYDSINGQKACQYVCYGSQTLLDMVNHFYCLIAKLQGKQKTKHLNSYCLIQDNFYYQGSQTRKKIQQLVSFTQQSSQEIYQEQSVGIYQMSKTKLRDLRVIFGRPYIYRHLEGCDHIIIFKEMKILTEYQMTDPIRKNKYPLLVFEGRMRRRKCEGCRWRLSDWVSLNDPLKEGKNLYLCHECHTNLHPNIPSNSQTFIKYIHD